MDYPQRHACKGSVFISQCVFRNRFPITMTRFQTQFPFVDISTSFGNSCKRSPIYRGKNKEINSSRGYNLRNFWYFDWTIAVKNPKGSKDLVIPQNRPEKWTHYKYLQCYSRWHSLRELTTSKYAGSLLSLFNIKMRGLFIVQWRLTMPF